MALSPVLIELLASRVCHDLISPVGAIRNGVEFAEDMGMEDGMEEALGLISHSANTAAARLQIFRIAYGLGGRDSTVRPEDIHTAFGELISLDKKITQNWDPHSDLGITDAPLGYCKALMCTLMLAQECLPKGGEITVSAGENTTRISATGDTVKIRDYVEECLDMLLPISDLDPRLVHPYVCGLFAKECGYQIRVTENTDTQAVFEICLL